MKKRYLQKDLREILRNVERLFDPHQLWKKESELSMLQSRLKLENMSHLLDFIQSPQTEKDVILSEYKNMPLSADLDSRISSLKEKPFDKFSYDDLHELDSLKEDIHAFKETSKEEKGNILDSYRKKMQEIKCQQKEEMQIAVRRKFYELFAKDEQEIVQKIYNLTPEELERLLGIVRKKDEFYKNRRNSY